MKERKTIQLITLDPGHFHAALVQKSEYPEVDSIVHVYAPDDPDVDGHLQRINNYNQREENPTHWVEEVFRGEDFFEKMIEEKNGNVVVLSGNNAFKTEYIKSSLEAGFNVLADKPMAINGDDFSVLQEAFRIASEKDLLLYDIMTERFEITTILQKEFSQISEIFGEMQTGSPENPAITKESVHHFFKYVSGNPLIRPAWFFDVKQQGEGVVDVSTHLVDLVFWECFPEQIIDYQKDIVVDGAQRWATELNPGQFAKVTGLDSYPDYLEADIKDDSILAVYSNGAIDFTVNGVHARVSVIWNYQAPEGAGDTHYSIMKGSRVNLVIRQGAEQNYKPALYIEPVSNTANPVTEEMVIQGIEQLSDKYPGLSHQSSSDGWEIIIPEKYNIGHEAHFAQVMENFLQYMKEGKLPEWEVPNMIAKYFVTTEGYKKSR